MSAAASRDLRNNTRALLDRVNTGETITITVDGRPVAELGPLSHRPRWLSKEQFIQTILRNQADSGLTVDLEQMSPDTTDDLLN